MIDPNLGTQTTTHTALWVIILVSITSFLRPSITSLRPYVLDSITSFLSHKIHILKMAMLIENLDCDYKRVFRDRTNSIEIIRQIHNLSWRIYTIIIFHSTKYTRL